MNIAVCDDQAEELETVTELLRQWQAQRRCPLHFRTFRSRKRRICTFPLQLLCMHS